MLKKNLILKVITNVCILHIVWDKKWGFKERLKLKVLFFRKGIDIVIYFRTCHKILIKILILAISNYLNNKNDIYTSIYFVYIQNIS